MPWRRTAASTAAAVSSVSRLFCRAHARSAPVVSVERAWRLAHPGERRVLRHHEVVGAAELAEPAHQQAGDAVSFGMDLLPVVASPASQ
jgi:hypothetical protein